MSFDPVAATVRVAESEARERLSVGDFAAAEAALHTALAQAPERYDLRCLCAYAQQSAGRLHAARANYEQAAQQAPASLELFNNLGVVCARLNDPASARLWLERAVQLAPDAIPPRLELAGVLQSQDDIAGALACYERVLTLDPRNARAFFGMGSAFAHCGWNDDAIQAFETALALEPAYLEALNGLGIVCKRLGRYERAHALFAQALALTPDDPSLLRNQGLLLGAMGDYTAAERLFRDILRRHPDDADAHFNLASLCLLTGRLAEGFREYEYRWHTREPGSAVKAPTSTLPRWHGTPEEAAAAAMGGLVIYAEQGFGDCIQFSRYVDLVTSRFARVRLQTRGSLLSLMRRSFAGRVEVVAGEVNETDEAGFSHHCPLLSLPFACKTDLANIPASVPYLVTAPEKRAAWQERLVGESRRKIGLVWATGKRGLHKQTFDVPLELLAPLLARPDVAWYSLNKAPASAAEQAFLATQPITDWTAELNDFDDTAAFIEALDLVISVDTAVVHLAGALGKPVWLLNRAESEWRWLLARSDSPWYPTMRIFRQARARDWAPVIAQLAAALDADALPENLP
ncbi:tetratricopeptide repeat protein [Rhodocyclus gracilis]|uniref:Tetratricopeptide repeat protein n=1 Tax=Rhodocyclus tenuis TaxID=1066 RepID=A0A6L5JXL7_RHOTE|nr:tetratricopeptide repeat protein [Rhodocyclus gracilis]